MFRNGHVGDCKSCHGRGDKNHYELDAELRRIVLRVSSYGFGDAVGTFREVTGGFRFDPEHVDKSSVVATIRSEAVDMGGALFDAIVRDRLLVVDRFPVVTFASRKFEPTSVDTGRVTGHLTMLGVTRPVILHVRLNRAAIHPLTGRYLAGFSATATIRRSDFGMTLALPAIGNEIAIRIGAVGKRLE